MRKSILFLISIILIGCTSVPVQLSDDGKDVLLIKSFPEGESVYDYEELGPVSAKLGSNFRSPDLNIIGCRNILRNKAASMDADIVIIEHEQIGQQGSGYGEYASQGVPNAITLIGTAYKKEK